MNVHTIKENTFFISLTTKVLVLRQTLIRVKMVLKVVSIQNQISKTILIKLSETS